MSDLLKIKAAYFLGIGGIGMSSLARHFNYHGVKVFGYDKTATDLTKQLQHEGMRITYEDAASNIPDGIDLVVYTPAIPKDSVQLNYFRQKKFLVKKRSEVLQDLTQDKFTIAVAGSHGKTSVTTMIAHVLKATGYDCTAFLGGISVNYDTNYLHGKNNVIVVEADEFDRSFLRLAPDIAVITAVDTDHLDIYDSIENIRSAFVEFTQKIKTNGCLVSQSKVPILPDVKSSKIVRYNFSDSSADYYVTNEHLDNGAFIFDISGDDGIKNVTLHLGGKHNVENSIAAYAVARKLGIEKEKIKTALQSFRGVKRRFEYIVRRKELVYVDDYAHHPEEINALINAVRTMHPGKKITAVFQPHLFTRTRDLHLGFATSLDKADEVILLPIYPAREIPIPGVSSEIIAQKLNTPHSVVDKENLLSSLKGKKLEVLLTVGAGDIDTLVAPLKKMLTEP